MASDTAWLPGKFDQLSTDECLKLAASRPVGRISYVTDYGPYTIPVNHRIVNGQVYVLTSPRSKWIHPLTQTKRVCFEVDDIDENFHHGWSVLIHGRPCAPEPCAYPMDDELPRPWASGDRTFLLMIAPERVTGRRVMEA